VRATFLLDAGYATFRRNHVIVRTHPETGRKALYVNGGQMVRFEDMSEEERARPLCDFGTIAAPSTTRSTTITAIAA